MLNPRMKEEPFLPFVSSQWNILSIECFRNQHIRRMNHNKSKRGASQNPSRIYTHYSPTCHGHTGYIVQTKNLSVLLLYKIFKRWFGSSCLRPSSKPFRSRLVCIFIKPPGMCFTFWHFCWRRFKFDRSMHQLSSDRLILFYHYIIFN